MSWFSQQQKGRLSDRLKERKKIHLIDKVLSVYFLSAGLCGVAVLLTHQPELLMYQPQVTGAIMVDTSLLVEKAEQVMHQSRFGLLRLDNYVLLPRAQIAASVFNADQRINRVTVKGSIHNDVEINILEETPAVLWCGNNVPTSTPRGISGCYFANNEGRIYAIAPTYNEIIYPLYFGKLSGVVAKLQYPRETDGPLGLELFSTSTKQKIDGLHAALLAEGFPIVATGMLDSGDVRFYNERGVIIEMNLLRDIDTDLRRLHVVLETLRSKSLDPNKEAHIQPELLKHIDLRFPNKVYYE